MNEITAMTLDKIVDKINDSKILDVAIIGHPSTGKSTLAAKLFEALDYVHIIHTDDFKKYGFTQCLDPLLENYNKLAGARRFDPDPVIIVEGLQAVRMLREGARRNLTGRRGYNPQLVIDTSGTVPYVSKHTQRQMKAWHNSILDGYRVIMATKYPKSKHPEFWKIDTSVLW